MIVVLETETETDVTVIVIATCVGHEGIDVIAELVGNVVVGISDVVVGVVDVMTEEITDEEAPLDPGAVYTGLFPGSVGIGPLSPISSG